MQITSSISEQLTQGQRQAAEAGLSYARQSIEAAQKGATIVAILGGDASGLLSIARTALASVDANVQTIANGIVSDASHSTSSTAKIDAQRQLTQLQLDARRLKIYADTVGQIAINRSGDQYTKSKNRSALSDIDSSFTHAGNSISAARFALIQAKQPNISLAIKLTA